MPRKILKAIDRSAYQLFIGIDTGTHTGFAVWDKKNGRLIDCRTMPIHKALLSVRDMKNYHNIFVRIEDARLRKFFRGEDVAAKQQGAGSIKRDAVIWEDALTDWNIDFELVKPGVTSRTEDYFKSVTGWNKRTSNHARDAAWLVYGL